MNNFGILVHDFLQGRFAFVDDFVKEEGIDPSYLCVEVG
jgi:hypothetical protein